MYRVMIIDDEKPIRRLLRKTIQWEDLGYKVVGEAASGIEAINTIDQIQPDVILVDIKMPFMDGIEFSKIAIERYPKTKIIILTAYSDFEYARQCIGIGVIEYLLKPVDQQVIGHLLEKIKGDLESTSSQEEAGRQDLQKTAIYGIKQYIIDHYDNPELNLTYVARKFGFNSSYLSRKFHEEVGVSFIDYLTARRMDQAMVKARKDRYMYQVASDVGIPDPNYFGKLFKKHTGKSYSTFVKGS